MTDSTKHQDDNELVAAEYVLGLLSGEDRAQFAAKLAKSPMLQGQVRRWEEHFASFAEAVAEAAPPADLSQKIEARLFASIPQAQTGGFWNSLQFWRGLAIASLAGVVALGALTLRPAVETGSEPALVAEVAGAAQGVVKVVARYDEKNGVLRLNRLEGAPVAGRDFELWIIPAKESPISLGVLPVSATGSITIPEALRAKIPTGVLAITDEPAKGSPSGAPTGPVVASGTLTAI